MLALQSTRSVDTALDSQCITPPLPGTDLSSGTPRDEISPLAEESPSTSLAGRTGGNFSDGQAVGRRAALPCPHNPRDRHVRGKQWPSRPQPELYEPGPG